MSILKKYKKWNPNFILLTDEYWDFILSKDENGLLSKGYETEENELICHIDLSNPKCFDGIAVKSLPEYVWSEAVVDNVVLNNIGLTGIDNGFISYNKTTISNEEFLNILTKSRMHLTEKSLILKPISGNSGTYDYSMKFNNDCFSLSGGFLQGFYKLEGHKYQVLPHEIGDEWNLEFELKPEDYEESYRTLNSINPNNKGIFFYVGTRAENKFLSQYGYDFSSFRVRNVETDDEFVCDKIYDGYFNDEYITDETCSFDNDYFKKEIDILKTEVKTNDNVSVTIENYKEIETDNKFLIFDNTRDGFTTETWDDNNKFILTGGSKTNKDNLFLLLNNTKTGYTTETIDIYYESKEYKKLNIKEDITENAFALRVRDDGSIGYRYLVSDCNSEDGFTIVEEYSKQGIVKHGEWNKVNVKIKKVNEKAMVVYVYVNSLLKFISKELPVFNFRALNEYKDKQEGVPFNISIGGGTQGLCDSIWLDYFNTFKHVLPIEENFAGTFIGDIKTFKFFK